MVDLCRALLVYFVLYGFTPEEEEQALKKEEKVIRKIKTRKG